MAYNGSGNFSPDSSYFPVVAGALIESAKFNGTVNDIASGLSTAITKDGQTTITDNLPMAGFRHTGVGDAATRTDYASTGQVQDSAFLWAGTAGGTGNAITLTLTPAIAAYAAGQSFTYKSSASANTGAMTVNVNGLGAKAIQKNGSALVAGDHPASKLFRITYDGTAFQLEQVTLATVDTTSTQTVSGVKTFSGNNTHSGANAFSGNNTHSGVSTFTGNLVMSGKPVLYASANVAAHATNSNIWVSNFVVFTGAAVTFTDFADAPQAGCEVEIYCNTTHTFTSNANIAIPGGTFTAFADDRLRVRAISTTQFIMDKIFPYATGPETKAGVLTGRFATPASLAYGNVSSGNGAIHHPGGIIDMWGSSAQNYDVVTTADFTVAYHTPFPNDSFPPMITLYSNDAGSLRHIYPIVTAYTKTGVSLRVVETAGGVQVTWGVFYRVTGR